MEPGVWTPLQWKNPAEAAHIPAASGDQKVLLRLQRPIHFTTILRPANNSSSGPKAYREMSLWDMCTSMLIIRQCYRRELS